MGEMIDAAVKTFAVISLALATACASAPRVTEATKRIAANPPATVEGIVRDEDGRPVAGVGVRGIPRGKDVPWGPPAITDCGGRYRLSLPAPAGYAFLFVWNGRSVATDDPADPSRIQIDVDPGETRTGVDLVLVRSRWEWVTGERPGNPATCP